MYLLCVIIVNFENSSELKKKQQHSFIKLSGIWNIVLFANFYIKKHFVLKLQGILNSS